jgi:4-diphosphocytidyl-2-C-methyl-D-erythritol kinase
LKSFRSCAKLNLHLEVVGRRPDGYHDLRTVFQTIDLADDLRIDRRAAPGPELVVTGADLPDDRRNLAWRAAEAFLRHWGGSGRGGVRIEIDKRIPAGAGLGGGSSNAATVLAGMSRVWGTGSAPEDLAALAAVAAGLGADVPYFLVGGTAVGLGRGDRLIALEDERILPSPRGGPLMLALPPYGIATAEVFDRVAVGAARPFPAVDRALSGEVLRWDELIGENDLEAAAFRLRPELGALYTELVRSRARRVRMSGSGSTLFALFDEASAADDVADRLPPGTAWVQVLALGRAAWRRASGLIPIDGGG